MEKEKPIVHICIGKELTKEERKNFSKNHPGEKLCFRLRHPNFPIVISIISLLFVVGKPIFHEMLQVLQRWLYP